jgi:hypothetical protein
LRLETPRAELAHQPHHPVQIALHRFMVARFVAGNDPMVSPRSSARGWPTNAATRAAASPWTSSGSIDRDRDVNPQGRRMKLRPGGARRPVSRASAAARVAVGRSP